MTFPEKPPEMSKEDIKLSQEYCKQELIEDMIESYKILREYEEKMQARSSEE